MPEFTLESNYFECNINIKQLNSGTPIHTKFVPKLKTFLENFKMNLMKRNNWNFYYSLDTEKKNPLL